MKNKNFEKQLNLVNKTRTHLLLLVDDELKTKKNKEIKINSKTLKELNEGNQEFYIIEQNYYDSVFTNEFNIPKRQSKEDLLGQFHSLSHHKNAEKDLHNLKKNFIHKISPNKKKNKEIQISYKKLKTLSESLKINKLQTRQSNSYKNFKLIENKKDAKFEKLVNLNNNRRRSLLDTKIDIFPSYQLISKQLNSEFFKNFKSNLKKDKNNDTPKALYNTSSTGYDEERNFPIRNQYNSNKNKKNNTSNVSMLDYQKNYKTYINNFSICRKKTIDDENKIHL